jgi:hypothetical protein
MQHPVLTYAELGWRVFPCQPGGKVPLITGWNQHATTNRENIELWLSYYPNCNWGIATDGLLVVDRDPGAEHWPPDEQQAAELAATPVIAVTPRGGRHFLFKQPEGARLRNTQNGQLAEHVDTRADGGFIVVAPSTVNGKSYQWLGGELEIGPADLPLPPQWVLDKLAAAEATERASTPAISEGDIREGQRNGSLTKLAGAMRRVGADEATILAALLHKNETHCKPPMERGEVETIAASVARYAPQDVGQYLTQLESDGDEVSENLPDDPGALPPDLLNVPGFVADVMVHNLAGAHKPQPVLAMAGALALLATLTGRKVTDTQGTRTNLYCIGVAGTSTGKQRAREVNKDLLYQSGLEAMIGPESIGSAQGLVAAVEVQPAILFQLDEFGRYLKTMGDAREAYLYNIVSVLMRMFTDSASIFRSDAVVDPKRIKTIYNPHACVYGTTTGEALYNSLTLESLQDGFLSRVLIFEGDDAVAKRWVNKPTMPQALIEQARYWGSFAPGGNLAAANPQPIVIEATPSARQIMYEFDATAQSEQRRIGEPLGSLWPRAVEKANKLCLLYACSENAKEPIITDAAATWAVELVTHLTKRLAFLASRWVSENRQERGVKRLSRLIEDAGTAGISKSALTLNSRWLVKRDRDEHLGTLIESGEVKLQMVETGGRSKAVYVHRKHALATAA